MYSRKNTTRRMFRCSYCNKACPTAVGLVRHEQTVHSLDDVSTTPALGLSTDSAINISFSKSCHGSNTNHPVTETATNLSNQQDQAPPLQLPSDLDPSNESESVLSFTTTDDTSSNHFPDTDVLYGSTSGDSYVPPPT